MVDDDDLPPYEPAFYIRMNEEQMTEISFGRVPALIQEMAKTLVDWTQEDLRRNAAKPLYTARSRKP